MKRNSQNIALLVMTFAVSLIGASFAQQATVDQDEFHEIRIIDPEASDEAINALLPFLKHFPDAEEKRVKIKLTLEPVGDGIKFNLIETGFADDSTKGQHFRGLISEGKDGWASTELTRKWLCYRSRSSSGLCV
ncbi:MAG: hypothetical protein ABJO57_13015 [Lentilitoribacter sp.]